LPSVPFRSARAAADSTDWTFPATYVHANGTKQNAIYRPIPVAQIKKHYRLCVLFPHMKDSYWLAADYGVVAESERDHLRMHLFQAGGYTNLATQLNQMDSCIAEHYDAIILGAISAKGVTSEVNKAIDHGIPVIDFVNGVDDPKVSAHALVSFYDLAFTTAKYIADHAAGRTINVGFFPGPEGAGWSDDAVRGFKDAIKGTNVHLIVMRRGDTGENIQLNLIQNALQANHNVNTIVGVDIAAQAGAVAVRNLGLKGKVNVYAFDIIPPVYNDILAGAAVGSPTDFTVIQGRMAVDEAVRLLEGQKLIAKRVGPVPEMVTIENIKSVPWADMFAPKDFHATYTVP
jgi:protein TorT